MLAMFSPDTRYAAEIALDAPAPAVIRFHLARVRLNQVQVPEHLVRTVMREVGRAYPALSKSGRDLYVEIPRHAEVALIPGGVRLVGPKAKNRRMSNGQRSL